MQIAVQIEGLGRLVRLDSHTTDYDKPLMRCAKTWKLLVFATYEGAENTQKLVSIDGPRHCSTGATESALSVCDNPALSRPPNIQTEHLANQIHGVLRPDFAHNTVAVVFHGADRTV
jgi:hypothetical protein